MATWLRTSIHTLQKICTSRGNEVLSRKYSSFSGAKKFYKTVTISCDKGEYEVCLDKRKLKSPSGEILKLPNELLAQTVALEWDAQREKLKYYTMPVTNLCYYATDKPNGEDKSPLVDLCMNFLHTDTILFISDEPPGLADYQMKEWGNIISWAQNKYKVKLTPTKEFAPPHIPSEALSIFSQYLQSYNFWSITGFEKLANTLKSLLLSIALVERYITVEEAVSLSRLEQEYQITKWGNVEWHHDVELLESRKSAAACALFIHACSEDSKSVDLRQFSGTN